MAVTPKSPGAALLGKPLSPEHPLAVQRGLSCAGQSVRGWKGDAAALEARGGATRRLGDFWFASASMVFCSERLRRWAELRLNRL